MLPVTNKESPLLNWKFDASYQQLPEHFYSAISPTPVHAPKLVLVNHPLAEALGLDVASEDEDSLAQQFSGNLLPSDATPIAQAYAGHQFGHFTMLGDGRAHLLGEHLSPDGSRVDVQFKGSGPTPYARRGDGRAALGPMLREYIISEAMHALGIPTTRSLAVVTTGETVLRETPLPGAILTRIAASHLRVGTFEYAAAQQNIEELKALADYAIARHYPELQDDSAPYPAFLRAVMGRQIELITHWLRVGFIHGVMNTDNMTISGETIDYGPCAFMDAYDPQTVFSAIDQMGRYAYANQPTIAQWNLTRFAEVILPLLAEEQEAAIEVAEKTINSFSDDFQQSWLAMMRKKLGLFGEEKEDEKLIADLLQIMQRERMDYTNSFRDLIREDVPVGDAYSSPAFQTWWQRWQARLQRNIKPLKSSHCLMRANNPAITPRNHQVEAALQAAEAEDLEPTKNLIAALQQPYKDNEAHQQYQKPPTPSERIYQTFCGT